MMDYRTLLIKYIEHVGECEGACFLGDWLRDSYRGESAPKLFSDEEWAELQICLAETKKYEAGEMNNDNQQ